MPVSEHTRNTETAALITHIRSVIVDGSVVCAYVPTRTEPGSTDLLDAVAEIAQRVLLPITGEPGPLSWVEYSGDERFAPREVRHSGACRTRLATGSPVRRGMHADPCSRGGSSRNTPRPVAQASTTGRSGRSDHRLGSWQLSETPNSSRPCLPTTTTFPWAGH